MTQTVKFSKFPIKRLEIVENKDFGMIYKWEPEFLSSQGQQFGVEFILNAGLHLQSL